MENQCPEYGHICDCDRHERTTASAEPITHEWLKSVGFRWAEWERSGGKHGFSGFEIAGRNQNYSLLPRTSASYWRNPLILIISAGRAGVARRRTAYRSIPDFQNRLDQPIQPSCFVKNGRITKHQ